MAVTRIETIINSIFDFLDQCKPLRLSQGNISVPRNELYALLDDLKAHTPDEIKRYQKIIANREDIILQAREKAAQIEQEANERAKMLIDETEIMQKAYAQANETIQTAKTTSEQLVKRASEDAETIRTGVLAYANDMLAQVVEVMERAHTESKTLSEGLVSTLGKNLAILKENKDELVKELNPINKVPGSGDRGEELDYTEADFNDNK
ncbi:MAG: ATPase [Lachnospiraceae bacterium]|nr:ATPase [Lachnospiraceae bacterium]